MKTEQITFVGRTDYNTSYPPHDAKKGYVAKITGRAAGAVKFEREFLGQEADIFESDEGLYERQRGNKKGGYTRWYHVVLSHPEYGLIASTDCEGDAPRIAKLLDDGHDIHDIVVPTNIRPHSKIEGRMVFDAWEIRSASAAKKAAKATTIASAAEVCWDAIQGLSKADAKKVLVELRKRIEAA